VIAVRTARPCPAPPSARHPVRRRWEATLRLGPDIRGGPESHECTIPRRTISGAGDRGPGRPRVGMIVGTFMHLLAQRFGAPGSRSL
jgi:hypothetical protein